MTTSQNTEPTMTYFTPEDKVKLRDFADRNNMSMAQALRLSAHLFIRHDHQTAQEVLIHALELSVKTTPLPPQPDQKYSPLDPLPRVTHSANKAGDQ